MLHLDLPTRAALAAAVLGLAMCASPAGAQATPSDPSGGGPVLDVPYMPQSQDLCGGAAIAMLFRYWGERGIAAEEFSPLVRADAAGIPTGVLTDAVKRRGWAAYPFTGSADSVRHHLSRGRPVIALIAIGPQRYHYVVVLAWHDDAVVVHDPAIAPSRSLRVADFEAAWSASGRWSLLVLPEKSSSRVAAAPGPSGESADVPGPDVPAPCTAPLQRGLAHARGGNLDAARAALEEARQACPSSSIPPRELAGLALLQRRTADAAALASEAVALDPADAHAWRVLATSRFLLRDRAGALAAWNRVTEPRIDLVQVDGLTRTRFRIVADMIDVSPGHVLTPDALAHAERRIGSLPAIRAARIGYRPVPGGLAEVDAAVVERPLAPRTPPQVAAMTARALVNREVTYAVASPLGSGELWHAAWRFWEARPAVMGGVSLPVFAGPVRGVLGVMGRWEEQSYAGGPGGPVLRERRRSAHVSLADWATPRLRWEASAGVDRWRDADTYGALGVAVEGRLAGDRASVRASVEEWIGTDRFGSAALSAAWRSGREPGDAAWLASGTLALASSAAPLGVWEGAGTGHGRSLLLRAHPLLDEGVIDGAVFGRRVAHVSMERRHPLGGVGPLGFALAGFADAARHWKGFVPGSLQVDAGLGLRVRVPGEGTLRIDVARGLRDGGTVVSAGWQAW